MGLREGSTSQGGRRTPLGPAVHTIKQDDPAHVPARTSGQRSQANVFARCALRIRARLRFGGRKATRYAQRAVNARTLRHVWTPALAQEEFSGLVQRAAGSTAQSGRPPLVNAF